MARPNLLRPDMRVLDAVAGRRCPSAVLPKARSTMAVDALMCDLGGLASPLKLAPVGGALEGRMLHDKATWRS